MHSRILFIGLALLLLSGNAAAMTLDGRCAIRFYAASTLHDFEGQATCQPFVLAAELLPDSREVVRQPVVTVLVNEMDTDNSGRDEKMRKMFDSARFPTITGAFADLDVAALLQQFAQAKPGPGTLEFTLQIRDVTQKVAATVRDLARTPEQITFTLEFPLSLASYALEPPSVLGMIKVDDRVRVVARVILSRQPPTPN